MIAKRTVAVYKPKMRTNKRNRLSWDLKRNFSLLPDPELMKNADKHVQIDNTDVPWVESNSSLEHP